MYSQIIENAVNLLCIRFDEDDVMIYVFRNVGHNPYIFKEVWQKIMFRIEFTE